jgi:hypothetical protein
LTDQSHSFGNPCVLLSHLGIEIWGLRGDEMRPRRTSARSPASPPAGVRPLLDVDQGSRDNARSPAIPRRPQWRGRAYAPPGRARKHAGVPASRAVQHRLSPPGGPSWSQPGGDRPPSRRHRKLEGIAAACGLFDPAEFEDRYENAVVEMLKQKQAGMPVRKEAPIAAPSTVINLMDALRRSIQQERPVAKKGKAAQARALPSLKPAIPRKARKHASCTTSSASGSAAFARE